MALYCTTAANVEQEDYPDGWRHWVIVVARKFAPLPFVSQSPRLKPGACRSCSVSFTYILSYRQGISTAGLWRYSVE